MKTHQGGAGGPGFPGRSPQGGTPPSKQGGAGGPGFPGRSPQGGTPPSGRGLVAPTLCPRCDASAPTVNGERPTERCPVCSLQLSWCGNCRGVAGPFDRFCGFCGFELIRGEPRSRLWRLWQVSLVALLAAGLGTGLWAAGVPSALGSAARSFLSPAPASNEPAPGYESRVLGIHYSVPGDWAAGDLSTGASPPQVVVLSHSPPDRSAAADAGYDLTKLDHAQSAVITLSRPPVGSTVVADARDPVAALTSEVAPLVAAPPSGLNVDVAEPVHAATVGNRTGAVVVLKLTRGDTVTYLRRALVYAPRQGVAAMFQADALAPAAEWPAVDTAAIATVLRSLNFE